jgi:IS30 family transposase
MKKTYPEDLTMRLCPETISALLLRENHGLHKRLASKLPTGRHIRKTLWHNRVGQGSQIRNMTMNDQFIPAGRNSRLAGGAGPGTHHHAFARTRKSVRYWCPRISHLIRPVNVEVEA